MRSDGESSSKVAFIQNKSEIPLGTKMGMIFVE